MNFPKYIVKLIDDIAVSEGLLQHKLESNGDFDQTNGVLSQILILKLIGTKEIDGKVENVVFNLFCKIPPYSSTRRDMYQTMFAFEREVEIYSKVLPLFVQFQKDKELSLVESFTAYPNIRVAISDEANNQSILIMNDLRQNDFKLFPRQQRTDIEHATLFISELAKFHAISFAFKDQQPKLFEQLVKKSDVCFEMLKQGKFTAVIDESLDRGYRMLNNERHKQVMADLKSNYMNYFDKFTKDEEIRESGVLIHGDCWNNNLLFRYKENENLNHPEAIKFVDWQLSRYASPVIDINLFIFTATDKAFREKNYHNLLNIYHFTLSANIRKLGSDPKKLFPFEMLEKELRNFAWHALLYGCFMGQFCIANQEHFVDVDEYCERLKSGEKCSILSNFDDNEAFGVHINDLFDDVSKYNTIV